MTQQGPQVDGVDERGHRGDSQDESDDVDLVQLTGLIASVLASEGIPPHAEASLTLVSSEAIAELKAQHLDGDGSPTDVLSFPIDGAESGDPDNWLVGDIVVCPEVARGQAAGHAGTLNDELALLVVHGSLHLVGWDHADQESRAAMWSRERELMGEFYGATARDPWVDPEESP